MRVSVRLLFACAFLLGSAVVGWASGSRPQEQSLRDLYDDYTAFVQAWAGLSHMGLALGVQAPQVGDVDFADKITVVIFVSEAKLYQEAESMAPIYLLLCEWDEIPEVEVVTVLPCAEESEFGKGWPARIETVSDPGNTLRYQYNIADPVSPGLSFFFVDRTGMIVYRWLGLPVFGEGWASFLSIAGHLAEGGDACDTRAVQSHPDNSFGKHVAAYDFLGLDDTPTRIPGEEVAVLLFLRGVPGVARSSAASIFRRLADEYGEQAAFYVVTPDVSAEGLLASQEACSRGLIDTAVDPLAESTVGPLPGDLEGIRTWIRSLWDMSTLPMLSDLEQQMGIPVLRDFGSRALFGWGLSLMGYGTYAVLDANGTLLSCEMIVDTFEPLYRYWLGELVAAQ